MEYEKTNKNGKIKRYEISYSQVLQQKAVTQRKIMNYLLGLLILVLGVLTMAILYVFWRVYATGIINVIVDKIKEL